MVIQFVMKLSLLLQGRGQKCIWLLTIVAVCSWVDLNGQLAVYLFH